MAEDEVTLDIHDSVIGTTSETLLSEPEPEPEDED